MKLSRFAVVSLFSAAATLMHARTQVGVGIGFDLGAPPPVMVRRAPPPRIVESVTTTAPGAGYVWLPGHYTWTGSLWAWVPGGWVIPPRQDARWVDGSWNSQTQQWVEGHWEVPASPAQTVVVPNTPPPAVPEYVAVMLPDPPPPPPQEVQTLAPGPGYVWIAGYWGWENGRRQWFGGHWERPPRGYRVWVAPRWEQRPNGYAFIRGYWM